MSLRSAPLVTALLAALVFVTGLLPVMAAAATVTVTVAVMGLSDDTRYASRRLEQAFPGHPHGRALDAARLAADEAAVELEVLGVELKIREVQVADAQGLPAALVQLKAAGVHHVLADLPAPALRLLVQLSPTALGGAMVINVGLDDDALRGEQCAAHLLHTSPSRQMHSDALAQYLAARNWRKLLLLQGPLPQDDLQAQALSRSAQRYGLKIVQTRSFKMSTDPRERDLANTRLLTGDREHEVIAVADSMGEFARTLPYATQWPRPVAGSSGLMALAWHPQWERHGGPQLSRRFFKLARRPMQGQDWAAWAAVKAVVAVLADDPKAGMAQQIKRLRSGGIYVDGAKGPRLSFRPWDGQLRQPLFLTHGDGVVGVAPLEGVLHPTEVLDTLGMDEKESACKQRP